LIGLSSHPARIAIMRRMTWDDWHDFVLVGAILAVFLPVTLAIDPYAARKAGLLSRVWRGLLVAALVMAGWIVAFWL
jgi:hypothetical protein